jgi:hypothetical protein
MAPAHDAAPAAGAPTATGGSGGLDSSPFPAVVPPPRGCADGHGGGLGTSSARQWDDDIDIVLALEGAAATGLAAGAGSGDASRLAAPQEAAGAGGASAPQACSELRCLDSEHPASCERCGCSFVFPTPRPRRACATSAAVRGAGG